MAWFLLTMVLGTAGYLEWWQLALSPRSLLQALFSTVQLFVLQTPTFDRPINGMLEAARWMAALFLGGSVYQVARALLTDEIGTWKLRRLSGHTVITGLGRRGLACARAERARSPKRGIVVVDQAPDEAMVRACDAIGARVITGDAGDAAVLDQAGVGKAAALYALCPDDGTNCETAVQATLLRKRRTSRGEPLDCHVQVADVDLRVELQRHAAAVAPAETAASIRFFDMFDLEAHRALLHGLPIDHGGIAASEPRRAHLVILGFGRMGRAVALRAARLGHFANAVGDPSRRLRISVIDREAPAREAALLYRYLGFPLAAELELHQLEIESAAARTLLEGWCADLDALTSIAICFDNEPRAVEVCLRLLPLLQAHDARVALRVARRAGLASLVNSMPAGARPPVVLFGGIDQDWWNQSVMDTRDELLARIIHFRFVSERLAGGSPGDNPALAPWNALAEDLRESNRQQADHVPIKLRAIGCEIAPEADPRPAIGPLTADQIETLAAMEHNRWNGERWLAGWQFAPGPKNLLRRTSPYLVPWAELPDEVREYDRQSVRLIPELLAAAGTKAVRQAPG